jgi:hypothetical protein
MSDKPLKERVLDFNEVFYKTFTEQIIGAWDLNSNTAGGCS